MNNLHKELRIGNWVEWLKHYFQFSGTTMYSSGPFGITGHHLMPLIDYTSFQHFPYYQVGWEDLHPIPLTPELLISVGFEKISIDNAFFSIYDLNIGRERAISVQNVGTPNEMIFLTEKSFKHEVAVTTIRNFDYDGKTYLHQLQNIAHSLGGIELSYNPIN